MNTTFTFATRIYCTGIELAIKTFHGQSTRHGLFSFILMIAWRRQFDVQRVSAMDGQISALQAIRAATIHFTYGRMIAKVTAVPHFEEALRCYVSQGILRHQGL